MDEMLYLRLLFLTFLHIILLREIKAQDKCTERCKRIDARSLERLGFDSSRREALFEKQRPLAQMKRVCWRTYDYLDCMKKCQSTLEHVRFSKFTRNKCRFALQDMEENLNCISRHHTFIRLRCSSFLKEAVSQRRQNLSITPNEESCRLLGLNMNCLENHIVNYCSRAKKIFTRKYFRDYFLNFVLPEDDLLFDEVDLNVCQIAVDVNAVDATEKMETTTEYYTSEDDYANEEGLTKVTVPDSEETTVKILPTDTPEERREEERREFTELLNELITSTEINNNEYTMSVEKSNFNEATILKSSEEESVTVSQDKAKESETNIENSDNPDFEKIQETSTSSNELKSKDSETPWAKNSTDDKTKAEDYQYEINNMDLIEDSEIPIDEDKVDIEGIEEHGGGWYETSPQIDIVPIQSRGTTIGNLGSEVIIESSSPYGVTTSRKKLFSDDSLEDIPPNFMYSSSRGHYSTTSRYILANTNPENSEEEFVPLYIDTSTLMGLENNTLHHEEIAEQVPEQSTEVVTVDSLERFNDKSRPIFSEKPTIKKILNFNEVDEEDGETSRERSMRKSLRYRNKPGQKSSREIDTDSGNDSPSKGWSLRWEHAPIIAMILLIILFLLLAIFILMICNKKSSSYEVHKINPENQLII